MYGVRIEDVSKWSWSTMPPSIGCQDSWWQCVGVSSGDTVACPHFTV